MGEINETNQERSYLSKNDVKFCTQKRLILCETIDFLKLLMLLLEYCDLEIRPKIKIRSID